MNDIGIMLILSSDPHRSQGFTLIEVLVAILVLSLGLLGFAALQTAGLRSNHSAYLRSQATLLAYTIIDRMRTNQTAAKMGNYDIAINVKPTSSCTTVECGDLAEWKQNLSAILPAGDGRISRTTPDAGVPGKIIFTVIVSWKDSRDPKTPPQEFSMSTEL